MNTGNSGESEDQDEASSGFDGIPQIRVVSAVIGDDSFEMRSSQDLDKDSKLLAVELNHVPETLKSYRKAVSAVHAIPSTSLTLNAKRFFDACVIVAQLSMRKYPPHVREKMRLMRASPMFEVRTSDLRKLANSSDRDVNRIYQTLESLMGVKFTWNSMGEDSQVAFEMKSLFLTSYGKGLNSSRGWTRLALEPAALEIVLDPKMWATLSLQVMAGLDTEVSYSLYANAWRYINTFNKKTPAFPVEVWIELLKGPCRYLKQDPVTGKKKSHDLGDFKRRELFPAIEKINQMEALSHRIVLEEKKSGPKASLWTFRFEEKTQKILNLEVPLSWPPELLEAVRSLGFDEKEINHMSEGYSTDELALAWRKFTKVREKRRARNEPLEYPKPYFKAILENQRKDLEDDEAEELALEKKAQARAEEEAIQIRESRAHDAFAKYQDKVFFENWDGLPQDKKELLWEAFLQTAGSLRKDYEQRYGPQNPMMRRMIKAWALKTHPDELDVLLPFPQDRNFDAWLLWRLEAPAE